MCRNEFKFPRLFILDDKSQVTQKRILEKRTFFYGIAFYFHVHFIVCHNKWKTINYHHHHDQAYGKQHKLDFKHVDGGATRATKTFECVGSTLDWKSGRVVCVCGRKEENHLNIEICDPNPWDRETGWCDLVRTFFYCQISGKEFFCISKRNYKTFEIFGRWWQRWHPFFQLHLWDRLKKMYECVQIWWLDF